MTRKVPGLLLAAVVLVGACNEDQTRGISAYNATDLDLRFQVIMAGGAVYNIVDRARPRDTALVIRRFETELLRDGCTVGDLIAVDPEGREVARHPPPLCVDERWVVELPPAIVVRNTTDRELHFQVVGPSGTPVDLEARAQPGRTAVLVAYWEQHLLRDNCTVGDLIAIDAEGREVARHRPPLCGNGLWSVVSPAISPAPP